jgi:hypothetical protein
MPRQGLVHAVVHHLLDQMIGSGSVGVHPRTLAHGLKPGQDLNVGGVVAFVQLGKPLDGGKSKEGAFYRKGPGKVKGKRWQGVRDLSKKLLWLPKIFVKSELESTSPAGPPSPG